jgi:nucleotide-binding universal stress UspA family protein
METCISATTIPSGAVGVGIDGSPGSDRAMAWALDQAVRDGRPLTLAHGLDERWGGMDPAHVERLTAADDVLRADAAAVINQARRHVVELAPGLTVHVAISTASPPDALVELSEHAALVVVGSRGRGPVRRWLLGSVGIDVSRRAACPVVVVHRGDPEILRQGVLVSSDGSGRSIAALELAYRQASLHQLPLRILDCSEPGRTTPNGEVVRLAVTEAMSTLAAKFSDVRTTTEVAPGPADMLLVERSPWMDLIVVPGGSIADSVLDHANCPIAIVPVRSDEDR